MKFVFCLVFSVFYSVALWSQSLSDTVRLKAFMDGVVETHLRDLHIAGATVSIIKDGKVLMAKGYGFADVSKRTPVDPGKTLFRIGSVSKMFTWISVMQLVSQGKLKLDEDVNHYLKDFQIPETYTKPITLTDIMTHTPGFEDLVIGLFGKDSTSLKPLAEIFKNEMPVRVRQPGTFSSYSNHGTGMAAYIVEQVSGMSFNDYVEKNILGPLKMNHTTFRQPVPASLKADLSKGYAFVNGEFMERPFEYVPLYPVGSVSSTALDMTHFMQAILQYGQWNGVRILDSATLVQMESPAHRHHKDVNPMRYGFMDVSRNGVTVIGHGGNTFWFHSMMALFPETNTGLFISFNTDKGGSTSIDVLHQFMDEYYPEKNPLRPPLRLTNADLEKFAGAYRGNRYAYHDITSVSSLFSSIKVSVSDSSRLQVTNGEKVKYYIPVDSLTFREENTSSVIAFRREGGKITNLFFGELPIMAFDKEEGIRNAAFHTTLFVIILLVTLLVVFYMPIAAWTRSGYKLMGTHRSLPSGVRAVAWLNYFLLLVFYVGLVIVLSSPEEIVYGVPKALKFLLVLPLICVLLTIWMIVNVFRVAGDMMFKGSSRFLYTLIALVAIAMLWQLYYWNFIGFNY